MPLSSGKLLVNDIYFFGREGAAYNVFDFNLKAFWWQGYLVQLSQPVLNWQTGTDEGPEQHVARRTVTAIEIGNFHSNSGLGGRGFSFNLFFISMMASLTDFSVEQFM